MQFVDYLFLVHQGEPADARTPCALLVLIVKVILINATVLSNSKSVSTHLKRRTVEMKVTGLALLGRLCCGDYIQQTQHGTDHDYMRAKHERANSSLNYMSKRIINYFRCAFQRTRKSVKTRKKKPNKCKVIKSDSRDATLSSAGVAFTSLGTKHSSHRHVR